MLVIGVRILALAVVAGAVTTGHAEVPSPARLPAAEGTPMTIDFSHDPVLRFGRDVASADLFKKTIARAVEIHPAVREAEAGSREAYAAWQEAHSRLLPTIDLTVTGDRSLSRNFNSVGLANIIERSRPIGRTDAEGTVTQTLIDFGATFRRMAAARAREDAAAAQIRSAGDDVALRAISAWYDLSAYRALVAMGSALAASQADLRLAVGERIKQGLSAEGDLARVDTYTTSAAARLARYRKSLAGAESRYREAIGEDPPADIERPTLVTSLPTSIDEARLSSANAPQVIQSEAQERAARADMRAVGAENKPRIEAVIDAGRYGVFEDPGDYDVRGRVVFRHRLFGGGGHARYNQAKARYASAQADADKVREAAERDAAIAYSDLAASQDEVSALEQAYIANRRSRDVLAERFRVSRGTLIDVLTAEDNYFDVAASYIQAVTERDAERLVLLQRGGALLDALGVALPETKR